MSLSTMIGNIVDHTRRLALRWRDPGGVVHHVNETRMGPEGFTSREMIVEGWETACQTTHWEERKPRMTRAPATCLECLAAEIP